MIVTIASGKGGTGKTTVTTNLAASLACPVQVLDCDVEEPNAHLFLPAEPLKTETVTTMVPAVDPNRCIHCGACEEICQFSAIALVGDTVMTFPEMCHSCYGCQMVCASGAITDSTRELGTIVHSRFRDIELIYGKLRIGEAMAPPLISRVKDHARKDGIVLIDAPPGTSCPMIESLKLSDAVILVTEPTPFGLNDLKLAVGAVRLMGLPFGIVINRCDSGTDATHRYAHAEGIPILMEIPDDRRIAEAYARSCLYADVLPEWQPRFKKLYEAVQDLAAGTSQPMAASGGAR